MECGSGRERGKQGVRALAGADPKRPSTLEVRVALVFWYLVDAAIDGVMQGAWRIFCWAFVWFSLRKLPERD